MTLAARLFGLISLVGIAFASAGFAVAKDRDGSAPPEAIESPEIAEEFVTAAKRFIDTMEPGMQWKYLFRDAERGTFHFFPIARRGVPLSALKEGQKQLAYSLLSTALSHVGNQKALTIMSLGDYLKEHDKQPNVHRDSDRYHVTIFGDPVSGGTWGFRFEGFHLSINVTVVKGRWISVTPAFFGVIPAIVPEGPRKGLEVLADETGLARQLAKSFSKKQRETGFGKIPDFLTETVGGLVTGNQRRIERDKPKGLALGTMNSEQQQTLMKLVRVHIGRIRKELADQDLARIDKAGTDKIHFVWAGGLEVGEPHHYLVQGPTFVIEYDNTQDGANHAHCVYRDFDNDFGDVLVEHYHNGHHRKGPVVVSQD
jgi:hypothetical protein